MVSQKLSRHTKMGFYHFHPSKIVAKASDGQRYPLPLSLCLVVCDDERGSGPEGADDVGF